MLYCHIHVNTIANHNVTLSLDSLWNRSSLSSYCSPHPNCKAFPGFSRPVLRKIWEETPKQVLLCASWLLRCPYRNQKELYLALWLMTMELMLDVLELETFNIIKEFIHNLELWFFYWGQLRQDATQAFSTENPAPPVVLEIPLMNSRTEQIWDGRWGESHYLFPYLTCPLTVHFTDKDLRIGY